VIVPLLRPYALDVVEGLYAGITGRQIATSHVISLLALPNGRGVEESSAVEHGVHVGVHALV
jgi:hypothetical protein